MDSDQIVKFGAAGASLIPILQFVLSWLGDRRADTKVTRVIKQGAERMKFEEELYASWSKIGDGPSQAAAGVRYRQALVEIQAELTAVLQAAARHRQPPPLWRVVLLAIFPRSAAAWVWLLVMLAAWTAGLYAMIFAPRLSLLLLGVFLVAYAGYVRHSALGRRLRGREWLLVLLFIGIATQPHVILHRKLEQGREHRTREVQAGEKRLAGRKPVEEATGRPPQTPAEQAAVDSLQAFVAHDGRAFVALAHPEFIARLRDLIIDRAGAAEIENFGVSTPEELKALPAKFVVQVAVERSGHDRPPATPPAKGLVVASSLAEAHALTAVRVQWSRESKPMSETVSVVTVLVHDQWLLWSCSDLEGIADEREVSELRMALP